jgi:hypothetical protein
LIAGNTKYDGKQNERKRLGRVYKFY